LDTVSKILGSLWAPLGESEPVSADLVADDKQEEDGDLEELAIIQIFIQLVREMAYTDI
jgi:hypothetical protein